MKNKKLDTGVDGACHTRSRLIRRVLRERLSVNSLLTLPSWRSNNTQVFTQLGCKMKKAEIEDMIWEVDEDVRVMCFGKHCVARALRPVATLYA